MTRASATMLALAVFVPGSASARTWNVTPDGGGDAPTIQAALNAAAHGDEIALADGTYAGPGNRDVDFLGKAVTVRSLHGSPGTCVVDCEDAFAGFRFVSGEGASSVLADLTIARNGYPATALSLSGTSPTIRNVVVRDGEIPAVAIDGGAPLLTGCVLESNWPAPSTSGLISLSSSTATIDDCSFRFNGHATTGACVLAEGGDTTVLDSRFAGNRDCAISLRYGSGTIERCTMEENTYGVRLRGSAGSSYVVRDCTMRNNYNMGIQIFGFDGAGAGTITVERCHVLGNMYGLVTWGDFATWEARDCVFHDNSIGAVSGRGNVTVENCRIQGAGGGHPYAFGLALDDCQSAEVRNCLVTGNDFAGVTVRDCLSAVFEDCTIASNGETGSIWAAGLKVYVNSQVTVRRSILWGNCSGDGSSVTVEGSSSLALECVNVDPGTVAGPGAITLTDILADDPLFCAPLDCAAAPTSTGLYTLQPGSPALAQACGAMGALGAGCATSAGASLEARSWGAVKAGYR